MNIVGNFEGVWPLYRWKTDLVSGNKAAKAYGEKEDCMVHQTQQIHLISSPGPFFSDLPRVPLLVISPLALGNVHGLQVPTCVCIGQACMDRSSHRHQPTLITGPGSAGMQCRVEGHTSISESR